MISNLPHEWCTFSSASLWYCRLSIKCILAWTHQSCNLHTSAVPGWCLWLPVPVICKPVTLFLINILVLHSDREIFQHRHACFGQIIVIFFLFLYTLSHSVFLFLVLVLNCPNCLGLDNGFFNNAVSYVILCAVSLFLDVINCIISIAICSFVAKSMYCLSYCVIILWLLSQFCIATEEVSTASLY